MPRTTRNASGMGSENHEDRMMNLHAPKLKNEINWTTVVAILGIIGTIFTGGIGWQSVTGRQESLSARFNEHMTAYSQRVATIDLTLRELATFQATAGTRINSLESSQEATDKRVNELLDRLQKVSSNLEVTNTILQRLEKSNQQGFMLPPGARAAAASDHEESEAK